MKRSDRKWCVSFYTLFEVRQSTKTPQIAGNTPNQQNGELVCADQKIPSQIATALTVAAKYGRRAQCNKTASGPQKKQNPTPIKYDSVSTVE